MIVTLMAVRMNESRWSRRGNCRRKSEKEREAGDKMDEEGGDEME